MTLIILTHFFVLHSVNYFAGPLCEVGRLSFPVPPSKVTAPTASLIGARLS